MLLVFYFKKNLRVSFLWSRGQLLTLVVARHVFCRFPDCGISDCHARGSGWLVLRLDLCLVECLIFSHFRFHYVFHNAWVEIIAVQFAHTVRFFWVKIEKLRLAHRLSIICWAFWFVFLLLLIVHNLVFGLICRLEVLCWRLVNYQNPCQFSGWILKPLEFVAQKLGFDLVCLLIRLRLRLSRDEKLFVL